MTFAIPLLFCVLAWYLGGLPWIIVGFFTLAILNLGGARVKEISMVCALALIWLLAFKLTGDRRLFFPYSMLFAAAAIAAREHWFARGIAAPLLFFAIRIYQDASQSVLLVEAMFMVASLTPALMAREEGVQSLVELAGVLSLCSAIALIGLVF